jgi:hypothetical protein
MGAVICGLGCIITTTYVTILNLEGKIVNQTRINKERLLPYLSHFEVSKANMEFSNKIAALLRRLIAEGWRCCGFAS